jgi:hypothetical protein
MIGLGFTLSSSGKFLMRTDEGLRSRLFQEKPCRVNGGSAAGAEIAAVAPNAAISGRIINRANTA